MKSASVRKCAEQRSATSAAASTPHQKITTTENTPSHFDSTKVTRETGLPIAAAAVPREISSATDLPAVPAARTSPNTSMLESPLSRASRPSSPNL